jgi:hypothetical protein
VRINRSKQAHAEWNSQKRAKMGLVPIVLASYFNPEESADADGAWSQFNVRGVI